MAKLISTNPAKNYEILGDVEISAEQEIKEKVDAANKAKLKWKELSLEKRSELVKKAIEDFKKRRKEISELITKEMGKPMAEANGEATWSFIDAEGFFKWAPIALKDEIVYEDSEQKHTILYEPWGSAAVITPWNYPFEMFVWGVIPNLLAGNTVIFKASEECPLMGRFIEEVMAGKLPEGVFSVVHGSGDVGEKLVNEDINLIWFTGSTRTGQKLYDIAGKKFIKAILELGGSNPGIVFEDINPEEVSEHLYSKRFGNCGQVCMSMKRLIVHEPIFNDVVNELKKQIETKVIGYPEDEKTDIGSLSAKRQLDLLHEQVKDALDKGAKIITGGTIPVNLKGAYYMPTLLTNINKEMRVWKEEVFGPVLSVVSFKTEEEAIKLANDTIYGLGAFIFSKDLERAKRVASKIDAGSIEINGASRWRECNPFGGYKKSGMGREHGIIGFRELCQIKVISEKK